MIYQYQAINKKGEKVSDLIDAPNDTRARQKLRSQGLYVVKISQHTLTSKESSTKNDNFITKFLNSITAFAGNKSSKKQVGIFSRQLATLLSAGLPLLRAITDILDQEDNAYFKPVIADIKEKLESGASLSNSLVRHRKIFSDMYINMVRVGENLGSLDHVILRLADIEEKRNLLKSKIQSALWYPSFMIFFALLIVFFLMIKIVPTLSEIFVDMGAELPLPTKIVMGISSFLSSFWILIVILALVGVYFLNKYINTPEGRKKFDEMKLKLPGLSKIYNKIIVLNFTQNLGILLNSNVDIIRSFEIVKKIVNNIIIEKSIEEASVKIREGIPISKALSKSDFLPKLVLGMIAAGEASDNLDTMLLNIGKVYETELDLTISGLTSMIEPIIVVIMGISIGLIVVSVMLPMMEMNLLVQ